MTKKICLLGLLLFMFTTARSQDSVDVETDESGMAVVTVSAVYSGPALWKVTSDHGVMWILGEISPFPRKWKWKSKEFDKMLSQSQELFIDFSGYWMLEAPERTALDVAGKLPEGTTLKDVISPELHARVLDTAHKFGDPPLEPWRAFAATNRLVSSAMKTRDLRGFSVRFTAAQLGEWRKLKTTFFAVPEIPFPERLKNWQQPANEVCLARLVDVIGDGGVGLQQLGNAWAVGDIEALRELVPQYSFSRDGFRSGECAAAMHGGDQQARDYKIRRTQAWVAEAERAMKQNRTTLAVILMSELFATDGYLAALRAKGYRIDEP